MLKSKMTNFIFLGKIVSMSKTEINNIPFDNTAVTTNFSPNNTLQSDELLTGESFDYERQTNFSKLKRKIKITKIVLFSITVSVTGGAIVVGITQNGIGANPPTIEAPAFKLENKTLIYSFALSNLRNYKVIFTINKGNEQIYNVKLDKEQKYESSYDLSNYSGSLNAKIDYSNDADHFGNLYTFEFTI